MSRKVSTLPYPFLKLFYYFIVLLLIIFIPKIETIDIIREHQNYFHNGSMKLFWWGGILKNLWVVRWTEISHVTSTWMVSIYSCFYISFCFRFLLFFLFVCLFVFRCFLQRDNSEASEHGYKICSFQKGLDILTSLIFWIRNFNIHLGNKLWISVKA